MTIKLNRNGYLIDDNRLLCNHKHSASARKDNSNCDKLALYKLKLSFNRADRTYDVLSSNRNASTQEKFQINQTQFADALSNFRKSLETHGFDYHTFRLTTVLYHQVKNLTFPEEAQALNGLLCDMMEVAPAGDRIPSSDGLTISRSELEAMVHGVYKGNSQVKFVPSKD